MTVSGDRAIMLRSKEKLMASIYPAPRPAPQQPVKPPHVIVHKTDPRIEFPRPVSAFDKHAGWLTDQH